MRFRALIGLAMAAIVVMTLSGCIGTVSPPVDKATHLEQLILNGQTLSQVQGFMTDRLKARTLIYPADGLEKKASGNWKVTAKEGGSPGDTDAPYLALMIAPDRAGDPYFIVFFKNGNVMASEWFAGNHAEVMKKALGGEIDTGQ